MNARSWSLAALLAAAACFPAGAVITRLFPLADIVSEADVITAARVKRLDRRHHLAVLIPQNSLKGKTPWTAIQIRLTGNDDHSQTGILQSRLTPGRHVLFFTKSHRFTLGFVDGTWFRLAAPQNEVQRPRQFVHLELYLRRTYHASTAELREVVTGVLAGTAQAPPPDPDEEPGYGPA